MRRTQPIAALVLAAALAAPPVAGAQSPGELLASAVPLASAVAPGELLASAIPLASAPGAGDALASAVPLASAPGPDDSLASAAAPGDLLAAATPLSDAPVPRDAPELTQTPLADRDGVELADAGDPEQLLARAPAASATPPATSLPYTGAELWLTLLAGGGMVLAGTGLRLRLKPLPADLA
ncbi:hypothetical protein [Conexibacter woesei]|nr:hypothetical protein [Conexibacter woesei]